ncbi:hypothetical protein WICPIJ_003594 [Wickerhamomyces pijperi]|uniref:Uncharacterized protein n=1 Tax=Wickerhamomyces pijperi TaxID=599730 RepID=A0A9P8Q7J8_WICPI|nr:hypothetical protein WICPIJ_003594 [Wickerhamomyces pijperi]
MDSRPILVWVVRPSTVASAADMMALMVSKWIFGGLKNLMISLTKWTWAVFKRDLKEWLLRLAVLMESIVIVMGVRTQRLDTDHVFVKCRFGTINNFKLLQGELGKRRVWPLEMLEGTIVKDNFSKVLPIRTCSNCEPTSFQFCREFKTDTISWDLNGFNQGF